VLAANLQMTPVWGVMPEIAGGGNRKDVIAGVTCRF